MPDPVHKRDGTQSQDDPQGAEASSALDDLFALPEVQIQRKYWSFDPDEHTALLSRYPASLSWGETLRLHHLTCLELLNTEAVLLEFQGDEWPDFEDMHQGPISDLLQGLTRRLRTDQSPYSPRYSLIWQGEAGQSEQRQPELQGLLENASVTHLGCLEVLRLDDDHKPQEVAFIPLDDVAGVVFGAPGLFRAAKIFYEDGTAEILRVPLLYGVSWLTRAKYDHDGSMTRWCCYFHVDGRSFGIGVGHQDLAVRMKDESGQLFGIGSVAEIATALSVNDPRFREKCKGRGLDPDAVLHSTNGG